MDERARASLDLNQGQTSLKYQSTNASFVIRPFTSRRFVLRKSAMVVLPFKL